MNLLNNAKKAGQTLDDMLYSKYPNAFVKKGRMKEEYRGVSDILNGMTDGKVNLGYIHDLNYWKKPLALPKETFAQYGRILCEENTNVINMVQEIFPETTSQIELIISLMLRF